jgi:hypothetical protein
VKLSELLLAQLDREADGTRKALERVPEGKNDWRPHPKSMTLGYLAALVASMPSWSAHIIDTDELDLASGTGAQQPVKTKSELLQIHENALNAARKAHLAHHRGQLTVYLRLNDAPVPAIYGASADQGW